MYCKRSNKHTSIPYGKWVQEVIETFRYNKLILRPEGNLFREGFSWPLLSRFKDEPSSYTEVTIEPKIKMYYILLG